MLIKVNLKNPKLCDGCPCEIWTGMDGDDHICSWKYEPEWDSGLEYTELLRPQKCIDENGE